MALDEIKGDKVLRFLDEKWKPPGRCFVCGKTEWNVSNTLFEVREYHKGGLVVGGSTAPFIMATCGNCGYTLFFNAIVASLVERPGEKEVGHD
jgi:predicted nucleic-acid-binding Zn-ribbon protein